MTIKSPRQAAVQELMNTGKVFTLSDIKSKTERGRRRFGLHARSGWGKSSFCTYFQKPIFIETEAGLDPLIEYGLVPETPRFPLVQEWTEVLDCIDILSRDDHQYKTLVIDTTNGVERLCHEFVCLRDFGGDWGEKGFASYQKGYDVALADWRKLLNKLDKLKDTKGMTIFMLCHTKLRTVKNPSGPDYDKWMPDMNEKTWSLTQAWLDAVFFGDFEVPIQTQSKAENVFKKGKATGGAIRVLYTQNSPSYDAKNRMGLPEEIDVGESAKEAFNNFAAAIKANRKVEEVKSE